MVFEKRRNKNWLYGGEVRSMGKKYIIELEEPEMFDERKYYQCSQMPWWAVSESIVENLTPYTEPDLEQVRKEAYEQGQEDLRKSCVPKDEEAYGIGYNEGFQCGLDLAWDAARKIANTPYGEEEKVFGSDGWTFIVNHTAQEAIEKIRQYEQEKDRQARIEYNFDEIKDVLNTTMKEYNVSLDDIAEVLQKMEEN